MKKIVALLLAALLLLACTACGAKETVGIQRPAEKTEAPAEEPETPAEEPEAPAEQPETPAEEPERIELPNADIVFETVDMDGNTFQTADFAASKITMLNFWAPWCGPCCSEMPELEKLYQTYREQGFAIWGINVDNSDPDDTAAAIAETGITYPVLEFTDDFESLMTGYIPVTCFVNSEGKIVGEIVTGACPYETWESMLKQVLN